MEGRFGHADKVADVARQCPLLILSRVVLECVRQLHANAWSGKAGCSSWVLWDHFLGASGHVGFDCAHSQALRTLRSLYVRFRGKLLIRMCCYSLHVVCM